MLAPWKKSYDQLRQHIKSRDITLLTKFHLVKAMVFPVVMYGCESWTIRKAMHWRIDTFELWCWRRLLRVPWTARRSNQSILKEISPEYSLEGLMLKLKLQYFGHLMLGMIEDRSRRGRQRTKWLDGIINSMDMSLTQGDSEGLGSLACCTPCDSKVWHDCRTEQQQYSKSHETTEVRIEG